MKDFGMKNDQYDISKIPDIYDCIRYDLQHNMKTLRFTEAEELHAYAKAMADIVIPQVNAVLGSSPELLGKFPHKCLQECEITKDEKVLIAQCIARS